MRHFLSHLLSHDIERSRAGASSQSASHSVLSAVSSATPALKLCLTLLVVCIALLSSSFAQLPFPTSRADNARDNANTNETLLTPSNVNQANFGKLFTFPVDYIVMAQPLYVPNVNISGVSHNVIYVVTQADSVYAIDADTGSQIWYASMLDNVGVGATTASGKYLPCGATGPGFDQEGIVGTPVIDPSTNTMYLVAKSLLNTTVRHHLHALDITTGIDEQPPVLITATSTSNSNNVWNKPHVTVFDSLHQKNRPGLLLLNGVLYLGFGSNYCNDGNSGWVLSYDPSSLSQLAVFNTSPSYGLTSIWQAGVGLAADEAGNIFFETAESGSYGFDVPSGGQTYCNSVVKLAPDLTLADYFTPWYVAFLNTHDLDLSSTGALILPDQPGPYPHELIASGKEGVVYVLDRDNMGTYSTGNDSQIIQELTLLPSIIPGVSDVAPQFGSPAYWNNTVYFAPDAAPLTAFPLSGGLLGNPLTTGKYVGSHSPSISANGNSNGIMWVISGPYFYAFDAVSLKLLYSTNQAAGGRDTLPPIGHFVTQTVANGRVYVGTQNSLVAYGLLNTVNVTGGNAQTAPVTTALPNPIQFQVVNPYTGQPNVGATVTFSDGGKGGSFSPTTVTTDSNGKAQVAYTLPQKSGTYTLTINVTVNGVVSGTGTATATATPASPIKLVAHAGGKQTGAAGSTITNPVVAQVQDAYKNGVPGVTVTFTASKGGIPNPLSVVTDINGMASSSVQLPTTVSTVVVTAHSSGLKNVTFTEYSVAGPPANIAITSGNNQSAPAGTQLSALTVLVTDQYNNPISGNSVTFSDGGAGGTFANANPAVTVANGTATQLYTLPPSPGTVLINATATGVATPAVFTETGQ